MEAWSMNRKLLTEFLKKRVKDRFKGDPLVEVHEITSSEFRIRVNHMDGRIGPRYFRVKVTQEL